MYIRHDQYRQTDYPKFLLAQNCIKNYAIFLKLNYLTIRERPNKKNDALTWKFITLILYLNYDEIAFRIR